MSAFRSRVICHNLYSRSLKETAKQLESNSLYTHAASQGMPCLEAPITLP